MAMSELGETQRGVIFKFGHTVNHDLHFISSDTPQKQHPHFFILDDYQRMVDTATLLSEGNSTIMIFKFRMEVEQSKYVFEAKTIQRMEILVLSTLQWKMNLITPISFPDYIARRLGLKDHFCCEFLKRCDQILLSVISVATAIMLQVMDCVEPNLRVEFQNQLLGNLGTDKDKVDESCKLILELARTRVEGNRPNKRQFSSIPESQNDIMDLLFISDRSNVSWVVSSSVSSSPISKKIKTHQEQFLERLSHAPSDFLSIPH